MGIVLSSRPEEEGGLILEELSRDELELIAALLWPVKFGKGSKYRVAAYNLCEMLERKFGMDFQSDAKDNVDLVIDILDGNMNVERSVGQFYVEFNV